MRLIDADALRNEIQGLFKAVYNRPYSEFDTGQANALSYVLRKIDESPEIPKCGHWFCPSCGIRMVEWDATD